MRTACLLLFGAAVAWAQAPVDPNFAARVRAGVEARQQGRLDDAARGHRAAAALSDSVPEVFLTLGEVHHRRKDWPAAVRAFEKALALRPSAGGVRELLGIDYVMLGLYEPAVETLLAARGEPGAKPDTAFWLGLAYLESGRYAESIPHLDAARQAKPKDPDTLFYLARAYQKAAGQVQGELLAVAPDSARAHLAIAEDHAYNGRGDLAIEEYRRTAEIDPNMPGVHGSIGELLASNGKYDEAALSYAEELKRSPNNPTVHYRYGLILQQLGRGEEAARHLRKAVEGDPRIVDAWAELGKALVQQKRLDEAEQALLRALSMESTPETARTAHYQLGLLYRQKGDAAKSRQHLETFQELRKLEENAAP